MTAKIDRLVGEYLERKAARDAATKEFYRAEHALIDAIAKHDPDEERYEPESLEDVGSLKVVRSSYWDLDEDGLEEQLSRRRWYEITTRRVDNGLFWAAKKLGRIHGDVFASCVARKPKKPYIKVTPS